MASQDVCEQALAGSLYHFGSALSEGLDQETVIARHQSVMTAAQDLAQAPSFSAVSKRFLLDEQSQYLLTIAYICAIEPDVVAPYLKTTWYEQGPSISVFRALGLVTHNGHSMSVTSLLASNLITWRMLQVEASTALGVNPLVLDSHIVAALQGESSHGQPSNTLPHPLAHPHWSTHSLQNKPTLHECYAKAVAQCGPGVNQLNCPDSDERSAIVEAIAAQHQQTVYLQLDFDTFPNETDLRKCLRDIAIRYEFPVIYWPKGLYCYQRSASLTNVLKAWLQLNIGVLICDDAEDYIDGNEPHTALIDAISPLTRIHAEPLSTQQRSLLWQETITQLGETLALADAQWLAQLYPIAPRQTIEIAHRVVKTHREEDSLVTALQQACINSYQPKHQDLATLSQPKAKWTDMILPAPLKVQLQELMQRIRYRGVLETQIRGFRPGVQALFWGKPGTGKSMAAEAMAAELMLPLYKVNLANIASKWIGESEKHLAKLFDQAERQHAVLLFDEADAIFAKRSEVSSSHDKNANMGVSFLLQRMENYSGLLLLSTNFKNNLDEAFLRRFHSVVEFAMPSAEARAHLWKSAWQGPIFLDECIDHSLLAESFEFSPAQIANIAELSVLYCLSENQSVIHEPILSRAILRELDKHSAGYLAAQKVNQWRARQNSNQNQKQSQNSKQNPHPMQMQASPNLDPRTQTQGV